MDNKEQLKQLIISFGINQEEQKYWEILINRFDSVQAQKMHDILKASPELFVDLHHMLIRKIFFIKSRGTKKDWQDILEEEKKIFQKIISS